MISVEVDVCGGNEVFESFTVQVNNSISLNDLKVVVTRQSGMLGEHQKIFWNGKRLEDGEHFKPAESGNRIMLEHVMFSEWNKFLRLIDEAPTSGKIEDVIGEAFESLNLLFETEFFKFYKKLEVKWPVISNSWFHHLDLEEKYIEKSCEKFFEKFTKIDGNSLVCLPKRINGAQGGVEAVVRQNGREINRFHVKTHYNRIETDIPLDIWELTVYKMIELMGLGPRVLFIPNRHFSLHGVYIGTEEVNGFIRAAVWTGDDTNWETQLFLLSFCLNLKDLPENDGNYGADRNGKLSVIDFAIDKREISNRISFLKEFFEEPSRRSRQVQQYLAEWDLLAKMEQARIILVREMAQWRAKGINLITIDDYSDCVMRTRLNIDFVKNFFQ